jgi:GTP cyclohydrolase FolE2
MGAGNDGGYIDLTFTSTQRIIFLLLITDEEKREKQVEGNFVLFVLLKRSQKGVYTQRRNLYL